MRRIRFAVIVIGILFLAGCGIQVEPASPQAVQGTIDLSGWDFADGTVPLSGEWEFYWNRLYTPEDFRETQPRPDFVSVPNIWSEYRINDEPLPGEGYATYRLHIHLKNQEQILAVKIPYASTAYKLWINSQPAAGNGIVGKDKDSSRPQYMNQIASFRGDADIIVQVSNFQHRRGGLFQPLTIGTPGQITHAMNLHIAKQLFIFGGLLTIGIYYLALFWFRRQAAYHLYFGLICITLAVHSLCEGEVIISQFFPDFRWDWLLRTEYITADIAKILLFPLFFDRLFPNLLHKRTLCVTTGLSVLFLAVALASKPLFFTRYYDIGNAADTLIMIYLWFILLKAAKQQRDGSLVILICFSVFIASVFNDILFSMGIIRTGNYLEWGLDFFIFGQALLLAMNFSKSFTLAEKLSLELQLLNQTLEEKVRDRTEKMRQSNESLLQTNEQLRQKNEQIRDYEQSRKHLLTSISHELRTPITLIQGYLEALMYGVIRDEDKKQRHIRQIHSKTIQLNLLIEDLFELSRLEVKQSSFHMKLVSLDSWVQEMPGRFSADVEQAGIRFSSQNEIPSPQEDELLYIDPARIDQVLSNFIYNAIKYTSPDGTISIAVDRLSSGPKQEQAASAGKVRAARTHNHVRIRIIDNGAGIPEKDLPYIFQRFYTTGKKSGGQGLGLAIAKSIVELHEGSIGVESIEGEGSMFYFTLPIYKLKQD